MDIPASASVEIDASIDDIFDSFLEMDITRVMTGYGPVPEVEKVETSEGTSATYLQSALDQAEKTAASGRG